MKVLYELNWISILVRVGMAIVIGGLLGIERELKRQPAGFRTYMLVCLGAAMVMMTNQFIVRDYGAGDPSRLGAQVISGIGFLGVGTIIVTRRQQVKGLTTAAGLWAAACLGLAVGIGFYEGALIGAVAILLIMTVFNKFDYWVISNDKTIHVYASFQDSDDFNTFVDLCREMGLKIHNIEISKSKVPGEDGVFTILILESNKRVMHSELIQRLSESEGLKHIEEL